MASDVQELELEYYVLSQFYLLTCGGNLSHVFPRFQLAHMYKMVPPMSSPFSSQPDVMIREGNVCICQGASQ